MLHQENQLNKRIYEMRNILKLTVALTLVLGSLSTVSAAPHINLGVVGASSGLDISEAGRKKIRINSDFDSLDISEAGRKGVRINSDFDSLDMREIGKYKCPIRINSSASDFKVKEAAIDRCGR
jgi:hypothetical protein